LILLVRGRGNLDPHTLPLQLYRSICEPVPAMPKACVHHRD